MIWWQRLKRLCEEALVVLEPTLTFQLNTAHVIAALLQLLIATEEAVIAAVKRERA
jgi:hypothetical protein